MWPLPTMHITQLNRECLLHLFSFLDKDSRKSLARTCSQLHDVFEDPALWSLLHFRSLTELQKDNFLLGPALRSLSICWHSSRVQVCSIEDWLKSAFQRSICSRHESLVNDFLLRVCDRGLSLKLDWSNRHAPLPCKAARPERNKESRVVAPGTGIPSVHSRPRTLLGRGRGFPLGAPKATSQEPMQMKVRWGAGAERAGKMGRPESRLGTLQCHRGQVSSPRRARVLLGK
uniref:F-box and leucine-rich protein 22 n=1 Tax=Pongo abelii TaxID=9601 RepID=A0A8I5YUZ2_PONAB